MPALRRQDAQRQKHGLLPRALEDRQGQLLRSDSSQQHAEVELQDASPTASFCQLNRVDEAAQQRVDVLGLDTLANAARVDGCGQELVEEAAQLGLDGGGLRQHAALAGNDRCKACVFKLQVERPPQKRRQAKPGVGLTRTTLRVFEQSTKVRQDHRLDKRFGRRKVPIDGTDADLGSARDLVELQRAAIGDGIAGRSKHALPIARTVSPKDVGGVSRSLVYHGASLSVLILDQIG